MSERQEAFIARRQSDWNTLEGLLVHERALHHLDGDSIAEVGRLYRAVASDLMTAQAANYTRDLIAHLDVLAARSHAALYSAPPYRLGAIGDLLRRDFPRSLRRHVGFFWLAAALFALPTVLGFTLANQSRALAVHLLPAEMAQGAETMYAEDIGRGRSEDTDAGMAGFYVRNNIGVAFRCFATGILFCVGTVFFLVVNGLTTGAFAGLVTANGHGMNLLTFVVGHGAFELTAIVIAGQAGLLMGYALVDTGGLTRWASLRRRTRDIANLVLGAAVMLLIAAFVEGFWSPSSAPRAVKFVMAGLFWLMVIVYFASAGRSQRTQEPRP